MLISEKNYDDDDVWCLDRIFYRNFQKKKLDLMKSSGFIFECYANGGRFEFVMWIILQT